MHVFKVIRPFLMIETGVCVIPVFFPIIVPCKLSQSEIMQHAKSANQKSGKGARQTDRRTLFYYYIDERWGTARSARAIVPWPFVNGRLPKHSVGFILT